MPPRSASPTSPPWAVTSASRMSSLQTSTTWCRRRARRPSSPPTSPTSVSYAHNVVERAQRRRIRDRVAPPDVIAFGSQPIFGVQAQVWGSPPPKPTTRSVANAAPRQRMPGRRTANRLPDDADRLLGSPSLFKVLADTWEEPHPQAFGLYASQLRKRRPRWRKTAKLKAAGSSTSNRRSKSTRPPTSPTPPPAWTSRCTSPRTPNWDRARPRRSKTRSIRFPAGMAVNASQAAGLGACSEAPDRRRRRSPKAKAPGRLDSPGSSELPRRVNARHP